MVTNRTLFWWLKFSKCQGWYPNMFSRLHFQVYPSHRNRKNCTLYLDTKSKGKQSLNRKTLVSFLWLLKTIWSLQQFKMPLKDFLNLVLVCKETSPRYGSDKIKVFFSTVVTWGCFMTNLLITILKHLSINDKGYPFFKNTCFKKWSSSLKSCPIGTNFRTSVS